MEYMGIWEAQHIGVIQSADYVFAWVWALALAAALSYKVILGISAIKNKFSTNSD